MRYFLLPLLAILLSGPTMGQDLMVFELFTDHTVLQRQVKHPLWGWAKPNRRVIVDLDGKKYDTRAGKDGRWEVMLAPMPAGGPHTLEISAGRQSITLQDIHFGDVYLLSGQSNMEWRLVQSDPDSLRAEAIQDPSIREVKVARSFANTPQEHLEIRRPWSPGNKQAIADFSGVGSYFAHYLREGGVKVPIGLVHSSWGGSRIEPWISAEALNDSDAPPLEENDDPLESVTVAAREFYAQEFGGEEIPKEDKGKEMGYLNDRVDTEGWGEMELPGVWESRGYRNVDGVFYFRRSFELTQEQADGAATLYLGAIDDGDETHLNGQLVGETPDAYSEDREYAIPAGLLRVGENTLAIRVRDGGGGGGFTGAPAKMRLATVAGEVPLAGKFHYRIGEWRADGQHNKIPNILYNAMIAPLRAWPLTGVLWYQGESNAGPADAEDYAELKRKLVKFWRVRFAKPDLPFYWVQLANFQPPPSTPDEPGWATLRASQTAALDLPNTGQAVIIDIGEADDIHPQNKWEVGRRLSLHALKNIYGQAEIQASSPVATRAQRDGAGVTVEFTELGAGLTVKGVENDRYGYLQGFTVEDNDGKWHWAQAILQSDGKKVTVFNPSTGSIKTVRYAWANNPDDANLFSKEGLPVTPFELTVE